jgi:hypothetical protein
VGRIRSIKPEFPQSETIGSLSRDARLLFIQLWTIVDDEGRTRAASRMLASLLYPYDDDARHLITGWLAELAAKGCLRIYTADGSQYLEIVNWLKHQKIDHPSKSKLPTFDGSLASLREPSRILAPDLGEDRDKDKDQGSEANASGADAPPAEPVYVDDKHRLYGEGGPILLSMDIPRDKARQMMGVWRKAVKDDCAQVLRAIIAARDHKVADPIPWITAALKTRTEGNARKAQSITDAADALIRKAHERERPSPTVLAIGSG